MSYIGRQLNVPASTVQLTAEGAITAGKPCIVEADGDVAQIAASAISQVVGSETVFESASTLHVASAYDANAQKVVIAYHDNPDSQKGKAVVGTVSSNAISFGTPVQWDFSGTASNYIAMTYDANAQKVVIVYADADNSNYGTAVVGTVSGTSIGYGAPVVFESASIQDTSIVYDSNAQKVVIAYRDNGNSYYGTAIVGTVSGTSISFGSAAVFESDIVVYVSAAYDTNAQKTVITFQDTNDSSQGKAIVGTVSGTSISFGSVVVFETGQTREISAIYDSSAQKIVIAYQDYSNSGRGTAIVGTVSSTSISFGTAVVFDTDNIEGVGAVYDATAQKVVIGYKNTSNSDYGEIVSGTVSGTSITFNSPSVFNSGEASNIKPAYDSNAGKVVVGFRDGGNSDYGTALVFQTPYTSTNLTSENFIGFAENDCTDNGLATIQLGGSVNDKQTSLTAGQTYFVQSDGTIGTTADSPSVTAGTAVSATKILVKG